MLLAHSKLYIFVVSFWYKTHQSTGQSYIFFYQIWKSGQTGNVTRIASGCPNDDAVRTLQDVFQAQIRDGIPTGRDRFHLHITPDYSKTVLPDTNYKFFNKPYGLLHWMEHALQMPQTLSDYTDTIFIVLDPDQYILRPFDSYNLSSTKYSSTSTTQQWHNRKHNDYVYKEADDFVHLGNPISQIYLFGSNWMNKVIPGIDRVVEAATAMMQQNIAFHSSSTTSAKEKSHLYDWTGDEVERYYVAGPPYIAIGSDMYKIVAVWSAVVVPVYQLTEELLSEMFAYSVAAVHLNLPHQLSYSFMISEPGIREKEGWNVIDSIPADQVCDHSIREGTNSNVAWKDQLPNVLHFCQRYYLGPYFFSKYRLPHKFLSCNHPLLLDPTEDNNSSKPISLLYDTSTTPDGTFYKLPPWERQRQAYMLCHIIGTLNDAATYWKKQHCDKDTMTINLDKEYFVPRDPRK
jgi:peptidyl serine alpha-galactosyltransferase